MPIQVLPDDVAAQIAAGEVIERPSSVVKELIENALDAGARELTVEIEAGGRHLIRVSDDGTGIPVREAALAFARHSTSKLRTIDDLDRIATLGFRGEALASIAAVSRTTLITRHRDEQVGVELHIEGGTLLAERPIGAPPGTVVQVDRLFYNTPARLKFLKSESAERRRILDLVAHYAMAYPGVRFRLLQEGREQFITTGSDDLADVLVEAFGLEVFRDMLEVSAAPSNRPDLPPVEVYGFASVPSQNRSNRSHIVLFVNGREISDQSLTYAVVRAYHTLIPAGRFPLAVLMITVPPGDVDVNVHPAKAEVRFRSPDAVFAAVQHAIRRAVEQHAPVPPARGDPSRPAGWETRDPWQADRTSVPRPLIPGEQQLQLGLESLGAGRRGQQRDDSFQAPPTREVQPVRPRTLPILRVIGQVGATYIVTEGPAGLYLIDQHAAHERILYEQFLAQQAARQPVSQFTLATTLDVPPSAAQLLEDSLGVLAGLGFDLEPFGSNTFRVRAVPALLADQDPVDVLGGIVQDLESGARPGEITLEEKLVRRVCKAAAIKAGQILSFEEMQGLIQQLERCESPRTCPHGRPTIIHISADELARQFGRE